MSLTPRIFFGGDEGARQAQLLRKQQLASRVAEADTRITSPRFTPTDPGPTTLLASALRSGEALEAYLSDRGVSLTNTRHLNAQRRDALTASLLPKVPAPATGSSRSGEMASPKSNSINPSPYPVEARLLDAVTGWLDSDLHSVESWRAMLSSVLGPTLDAATRQHADQLAPIFKTSEQDRLNAIQLALEATEDLRQRLLGASLQAAGKWGLKSLLTAAHQKLVVSSVVQHAKDSFEHLTFKAQRMEAGFTGRRKFNAGDSGPNGRHASLDGAIDATGEGWQLNDRVIDGKHLRATRVLFPGDDPQNPAEWSNSTSFVSYEHRSRTGKVTWRRA